MYTTKLSRLRNPGAWVGSDVMDVVMLACNGPTNRIAQRGNTRYRIQAFQNPEKHVVPAASGQGIKHRHLN